MTDDLARLPVVPYTDDRVPNDYPGGDLPWQVFHAVRNALVVACRKHGPTGPMGVARIEPDVERGPNLYAWERGDPDEVYFIVDDQYNHERYFYAEVVTAEAFTDDWLRSVVTTLREFEGWGLAVKSVPGGYLLIFGDKLMVNGRLARCRTTTDVVTVAQRLTRRGWRRHWWQFWK